MGEDIKQRDDMDTTKQAADYNRARLLNMTAGGDGHTAPYIEKDARGGYFVHIPPATAPDGSTTKEICVHTDSESTAQALLLL